VKNALLVVALSAMCAVSPAHAKKVRKSILPPSQFDHPFEGTITVKRDSEASLPCRPRSLSTRLGCTYPSTTGSDKECEIYLALPDEIKAAGYSENDLWRHEIAFCNGWKGYRTLGDDSLVDKP
jgi:hypothetical protein